MVVQVEGHLSLHVVAVVVVCEYSPVALHAIRVGKEGVLAHSAHVKGSVVLETRFAQALGLTSYWVASTFSMAIAFFCPSIGYTFVD
jgi:hypothetical protein